MSDEQSLQRQAFRIREQILRIAAGPLGTHIGGCLSAADLLTVLYFHVLRVRPDAPEWEQRDYFVLSKGHASAALYAVLAERGFFPVDELATYGQSGARLLSHPSPRVPGVEFATGSLGHGLSLGVGLALAAQRDKRPNRAFVLLGDGELQEGTVWEAAMAAAHLELDNLVAIVDRNRLQISGDTEYRMRLEPLAERWASFGWHVDQVDGHSIAALMGAFAGIPAAPRRPTVLIANTVKGRGVAFLENRKQSHYATLSAETYRKALDQLRQGTAFLNEL